MPSIGPLAIQWRNWTSDAKDLVAGVALDFTTPATTYLFTAQGPFANLGNVMADGLAVDNLLNVNALTLNVSGLPETVPPYSKSLITLPKNSPVISVTAAGGVATIIFFRGTFHGSGSATNFYSAQQAANLATLTSGLTDAYLNTVYANKSVTRPAGTDLNLHLLTGWFDVVTPLNGPAGTAATIWHIESQVYSLAPTYARQRAIALDVSGLIFERQLISGAWSAWRQIADTTYLNPTTGLVLIGSGALLVATAALIVPTPVATYERYKLFLTRMKPTAGAFLSARVSLDNGVSYKSGAADYTATLELLAQNPSPGGTYQAVTTAGDTSMWIGNTTVTTDIGEWEIDFIPNNSLMRYEGVSNIAGPTLAQQRGLGNYTAGGVATHFRLAYSAGNLAIGCRYAYYGVKS